MTLEEIKRALESAGFPVTYRSWPERCLEMESILLLQLQNPGDILLREEHAGQEVLPIPLSWLCLQRHMEIRTKYFLSVEIGMDTNTTGWYKSILDVTAYMQKKIWECYMKMK